MVSSQGVSYAWLMPIIVCAQPHGEEWQRNEAIRLVKAMKSKASRCFGKSEKSILVSEGKKHRLGVCVTGQLSRLELESKARRILAVNSHEYAIDMVLVLGEHAEFVNGDTDAGGRADWTEDSIRKAVRHWVPSVDRIIVDLAPQLETPYVESAYLAASDKPWLGKKRIESHVRQWWASLRCWKHFVQLGCTQGTQYKSLIKIRDDAFVMAPLEISTINSTAKVILPECGGFAGYNDKWALLDARLAQYYFAMPLFEYYTNYSSLRVHKGNPENVLKRVLVKHHVPVTPVSIDTLPILTSRFRPHEIRSTRSAYRFHNATPSSCFLFDELKLGKEPHCWPSDCNRRRAIYCDRCAVKRQEWLRDRFLHHGLDPKIDNPPPCLAECRRRPISLVSFSSSSSLESAEEPLLDRLAVLEANSNNYNRRR